MRIKEAYKKKLEVIRAIKDSQIKKPHHIPVVAYTHEAETLYELALDDKEALMAAGLAPELIEDLHLRCGALREAESRWKNQQGALNKSAREWKKQSPMAYDLRKKLLADFLYAFRKHPDLMKKVRAISPIGGHAKMMKDLNDLSLLGKDNTRLLEAINFDLSLLDKAAQTSGEMAVLLDEMNRNQDRYEHSEAKKIRDQAYTHLKEAVDEILEAGKYAFRQDKNHSRKYASEYRRQIKSKQQQKPKKKAAK
jgi:predicted PolB exonuclease-like 3'-5' exonuclease